ncbi:MAG: hypothetical protein V4520_18140 [Bacteroidota bacterium]
MSEIENVNLKLGKKISSELVDNELINAEILNSFEKQLVEGKIKELDWLKVFEQKFKITFQSEDEA